MPGGSPRWRPPSAPFRADTAGGIPDRRRERGDGRGARGAAHGARGPAGPRWGAPRARDEPRLPARHRPVVRREGSWIGGHREPPRGRGRDRHDAAAHPGWRRGARTRGPGAGRRSPGVERRPNRAAGGGLDLEALERGRVLTTDVSVVATSRILVAMWPPAGLAQPGSGVARGGRTTWVGRTTRVGGSTTPADRDRLRFHGGTAQAAALVIRGPREAVDLPDGSSLAILRLDGEVAAAPGDRFALRRPSPARPLAGAWCWTRRHRVASHGGGSTRGGRRLSRPRLPRWRPVSTGRSRRSGRSRPRGSTCTAPSASLTAGGSPRTWRRRSMRRPWISSGRTTPRSPSPRALRSRRSAPSLRGPRAAWPRWTAPPRTRSPAPWWTVSWRTGRWLGTVTGCGTRLGPPASRQRRSPRWTGWSWLYRSRLPRHSRWSPARPAARPTASVRSRPPAASSAWGTTSRGPPAHIATSCARRWRWPPRHRSRPPPTVMPPAPAGDTCSRSSRTWTAADCCDAPTPGTSSAPGPLPGSRRVPPRRAPSQARCRSSRRAGRRHVKPAAIVLAGGASSRFGGDKLAADFEGRPVLEHVLRAAAVVANPIVLVVGPDDPVPWLPGDLGVDVVPARDAVAHRGPLAGLAAGLAAPHPPVRRRDHRRGRHALRRAGRARSPRRDAGARSVAGCRLPGGRSGDPAAGSRPALGRGSRGAGPPGGGSPQSPRPPRRRPDRRRAGRGLACPRPRRGHPARRGHAGRSSPHRALTERSHSTIMVR